jgi:hypothetical protein
MTERATIIVEAHICAVILTRIAFGLRSWRTALLDTKISQKLRALIGPRVINCVGIRV